MPVPPCWPEPIRRFPVHVRPSAEQHISRSFEALFVMNATNARLLKTASDGAVFEHGPRAVVGDEKLYTAPSPQIES
jgi:hypothetical protein